MHQKQKRYNTAMDTFTDFKLGMASLLKREKAGVAQVAMHSQLPRFLVDNFANYCRHYVTL